MRRWHGTSVGETPSNGSGFLTEDGDIDPVAAVSLSESFGLDEYASRSVGGVVDSAALRLEHFNQHVEDVARRIKHAAEFAFGAGDCARESFVDRPFYPIFIITCSTLAISRSA